MEQLMSYNKKHNKIKNTGILFELLTRQIAVDVLNNEKDSSAIKILKEFFNEKTELGKENQFYKVLIEKRYKNLHHAEILIEAVIKNRRKLSNRRLRNEKYNLIKEIKTVYDAKDFFNTKIPNYKILASIYNLFEGESSREDFGPVIETDSKVVVMENITDKTTSDVKKSKNKTFDTYNTQEEDIRLLTYQLLVDKFNKKYSTLNESQKNLLREYINNLSNTNSLREFIDAEVIKIRKLLSRQLTKVTDKITKIKLTEAIIHSKTATGGTRVRDSHVVSLMRYYELVKELENVHKNK
jgi:hypothetical protein|tara:strand:- start:728 stop:1618 length:891 start_codon:yes stop_codon:yes gene_type:complete